MDTSDQAWFELIDETARNETEESRHHSFPYPDAAAGAGAVTGTAGRFDGAPDPRGNQFTARSIREEEEMKAEGLVLDARAARISPQTRCGMAFSASRRKL